MAENGRIREAIEGGILGAYLAETVFTLEQIGKDARKALLGSYKPVVATTEAEEGGSRSIGIAIGPNPDAHPGTPEIVARHLADAIHLGMRLLRAPRIAGIVNPDIDQAWFVTEEQREEHVRQERFGRALEEIEGRGGGMSHIKTLGQKYALPGEPWTRGLSRAPLDEERSIQKAVAEWADGDAIAAHYAYGNDFFCTEDVGKAAGSGSVLHPDNRAWLESKLGVRFVTPEGLAKTL